MLENIQYYEPTRFMGVTRIFEKIEEGIRGREAELTGLKRAVFNWAQRQALHHHKQEINRGVPFIIYKRQRCRTQSTFF